MKACANITDCGEKPSKCEFSIEDNDGLDSEGNPIYLYWQGPQCPCEVKEEQ